MRLYLISDNVDTKMGMRLAGIDGIIVHEKEEVDNALDFALSEKDIGIILITVKLAALCEERVNYIKLNKLIPLIVEVPDRHGDKDTGDIILKYVKDCIGIG